MNTLFNTQARKAFNHAVRSSLIPAQSKFSPRVGFDPAMAVYWTSDNDDAEVFVYEFKSKGNFIVLTHDDSEIARYAKHVL